MKDYFQDCVFFSLIIAKLIYLFSSTFVYVFIFGLIYMNKKSDSIESTGFCSDIRELGILLQKSMTSFGGATPKLSW